MKKDQIESALIELITDIFDDDSQIFTINTTKESVEAWNSLGHIRLLTTVEEEFSVKFDLEEIEIINSVKHILELIQKKKIET